ncbi:hypothetical protein MIR68_002403 [Amoeboaphelidium protococcarum]|nr:hypothetical protein MIR68_002403 [Amoeboaphelidium protococcarum]
MGVSFDIYIAFGVLFVIFVIVTDVLFFQCFSSKISYIDSSNELSKRNGELVLISSVGSAVIVLATCLEYGSLTDGMGISCFATNLLFNMGFAAFIWPIPLGNVRIFIHYRLNRIKADFLQYQQSIADAVKPKDLSLNDIIRLNLIPNDKLSDLSPNDALLLISLYKRYQNQHQYVVLFGWIWLVQVICFVIAELISMSVSSRDICTFTGRVYPYIPMYIANALVIFVIAPLQIYLLRGVYDAYGMIRGLKVGIIVGGIGFSYLFIGLSGVLDQYGIFFKYFLPMNPALLGFIIIQYEFVLRPYLMYKKGFNFSYSSSKQVEYNKSGFMQVLSSVDMYENLKACAVEEFCSENTLFWDNYFQLMQKGYVLLIKELIMQLSASGEDKQFATLQRRLAKTTTGQVSSPVSCLQSFTTTSISGKVTCESINSSNKQEQDGPQNLNVLNTAIIESKVSADASMQSHGEIIADNASPHELKMQTTTDGSVAGLKTNLIRSKIKAEMPMELQKMMISIYDEFIAEGAPFQLNVHVEQLDGMQRVVEVLRQIHQSEDESSRCTVYLEIFEDLSKFQDIKADSSTTITIPLNLYQDVASSVLEMLYTTTYLRLAKKLQTLTFLESLCRVKFCKVMLFEHVFHPQLSLQSLVLSASFNYQAQSTLLKEHSDSLITCTPSTLLESKSACQKMRQKQLMDYISLLQPQRL